MCRVFGGLIVAAVFGAASAIETPQEATLTLVGGAGTVVGVAEIGEGDLEIELLSGFSGLVSVTAVDDEGNVRIFDAPSDRTAA